MGASCAGDPMALARFLWHRRLERASSTGKLMPSTPIAAVVLAAGMGTRMKSDLHKVLHPLAGRPMLFHLLDSVAALDPERQVVVAGARREQVESALAGLDVKLVTKDPQLGTAHSVLQAKGVHIGRASCEARVGRCVENSGVGVYRIQK